MKVLMLVNWKIKYCKRKPVDKQPADYYAEDAPYWFYRYFKKIPEVDVVDISSFKWLEDFEKKKLRFYIWQTLRVIPRLKKYDLIISHGMQSGIVLGLWRRIFKIKTKHIVFDIGSFNSAAETGWALKLMQFASKSLDGVIYHTSSQKNYYEQFFPWIIEKSQFIRFGIDFDFFDTMDLMKVKNKNQYMLCVGYAKRDWDTLIQAYQQMDTDIELRLVGHIEEKYKGIRGVEQVEFVPIRELMAQIHAACFCILPLDSFQYSYGQMTLLQQMALKKMVIAARVPSLIDYVNESKGVLFYQARQIECCKEVLAEALQKGILYWNDMGKKAHNYIKYDCNEKIMAKDIERFLEKIYLEI